VRIFLDTNVLVSAFATRGLCADLVNAILAEHELVVGETVLMELRRVLKQKLRAPSETIEEVDSFLRREASVVQGGPVLALDLRDANDRRVLSEAVEARVDVLVTGDRDLLDIAQTSSVLVLDPRGLWKRLRSDG
jgi:putative PIN family toxin of toxin-antitoxin system